MYNNTSSLNLHLRQHTRILSHRQKKKIDIDRTRPGGRKKKNGKNFQRRKINHPRNSPRRHLFSLSRSRVVSSSRSSARKRVVLVNYPYTTTEKVKSHSRRYNSITSRVHEYSAGARDAYRRRSFLRQRRRLSGCRSIFALSRE